MLMRHATTFADLTTSEWYFVARRVPKTRLTDGWEWHIPPVDVDELNVAVAHKRAIKVPKKHNGQWVIIAKLANTAPPSPAETFARAGRGLFEQ